jgi:hypothetical protein
VPHCEAPFQNLLIAAVSFHALDQRIVVHAKKRHTFFIEAFPEIRVIVRRQFALSVQPDFIEHSTEIKQTTYLL